MEKVFYLDIDFTDDDTGMYAISFVDRPATEVTWNLFSKQKSIKKFNIESEEERIITSPVMLAETPIYRYSDILGDYWVKFSANTLKEMRKKYFKEMKIHNLNENHDGTRIIDGVYMVDSYLLDDNLESKIYSDTPKGSWIASFWVEDEKYWDEVIKSGDFNGFSLEGKFFEVEEEKMFSQLFKQIEGILSTEEGEEEQFQKIKKLLKKK